MVKNLSKAVVGGLLAGALVLPISGGIKEAYAGTEITNIPYYNQIKTSEMHNFKGSLENFIVEREGFVIVQRHLLKKGIDPREYFDMKGRKSQAVFKGNEIRSFSIYSGGVIPGLKDPDIYSEQGRSILLGELVEYLKKLKQEGYQALSNFDPSLPGRELKKARLIGIDELIGEIYQIETLLKEDRQKKR